MNVPDELRNRPQWVCWKTIERDGGSTKVPLQVDSTPAKTNDPATWCGYQTAVAAWRGTGKFDGIGYVFTSDDGLFGVDLDAAYDPVTGKLTSWAAEVLRTCPSYCEISPSGYGVKITARGKLPIDDGKTGDVFKSSHIGIHPVDGCDKAPEIAVYRECRFWTFTGNVLPGCEQITDCTAGVAELLERLRAKRDNGNGRAEDRQETSPVVNKRNAAGALAAMVKISTSDGADGSRRLFACACRCVEYDLSDAEAIAAIRSYELINPFPKNWSDADIVRRLRDAEKRTDRGKAARHSNGSVNKDHSAPVGKCTAWRTLLDEWAEGFDSGERPVIYQTGFDFEIGPRLITLIGGGPGSGKTTLVLQMVTTAMLADESIRCVFASVEVPGRELVERQVAIEAAVDFHKLRYREDLLERECEKIKAKREILSDALGDRLCLLDRPHDMRNVSAVVEATEANLVILDYIQRIPPAVDCGLELRHAINGTMDKARQLCDAGAAVIAVSSLNRPAKRGSGYQDSSITSFRESGELEYGADECWILARDPQNTSRVTLRHEKGRYRKTIDIALDQDDTLRFTSTIAGVEWSPA